MEEIKGEKQKTHSDRLQMMSMRQRSIPNIGEVTGFKFQSTSRKVDQAQVGSEDRRKLKIESERLLFLLSFSSFLLFFSCCPCFCSSSPSFLLLFLSQLFFLLFFFLAFLFVSFVLFCFVLFCFVLFCFVLFFFVFFFGGGGGGWFLVFGFASILLCFCLVCS